MDREELGREVRAVWVKWAGEQPDPKPSWLVPWEGLSEPDKEVDRRIGERIYALAQGDTESMLLRVVQVLNLLRVSTDQFAGAMYRYEDRAKEERDDIARLLNVARGIDIRLGVALNDHGKGDTITVGRADSIFVGNEAGEGINDGFPPGTYRARVIRGGEAILIERQR